MDKFIRDGVLVYELSADQTHYKVYNGQGTGAESETSVEIRAFIGGLPVAEIASHAFNSCFKLKEIALPSTIKKAGGSAFSCCFELEKVYISDLKAWLDIDFSAPEANPLYSVGRASKRTLYLNGAPLTALTVPKGVKQIKQCTFAGYGKLTRANLEGVEEIGDNAFVSCSSLSEVRFKKLKRIGDCAFEGCDALTGVTITESVEYIAGYAFKCCHLLSSVKFKAVDGWKIVSENRSGESERIDPQILKNGYESAKLLREGNRKYLNFYFKRGK